MNTIEYKMFEANILSLFVLFVAVFIRVNPCTELVEVSVANFSLIRVIRAIRGPVFFSTSSAQECHFIDGATL